MKILLSDILLIGLAIFMGVSVVALDIKEDNRYIYTDSNSPVASSSGVQASLEEIDPNDVESTIVQALRKQFTQGAYRLNMEVTKPTAVNPTKALFEYEAPDRFYIAANGSEAIIIGTQVQINKNGSGWQSVEVPKQEVLQAVANFRDPFLIDKATASMTDAALIGREVINGHNTLIYEFNTKFNYLPATNKIWIGSKDHLPYKMYSESVRNYVKHRFLFTYDYNPGLKINAPIIQ